LNSSQCAEKSFATETQRTQRKIIQTLPLGVLCGNFVLQFRL
jgi:hypothetical protein